MDVNALNFCTFSLLSDDVRLFLIARASHSDLWMSALAWNHRFQARQPIQDIWSNI